MPQNQSPETYYSNMHGAICTQNFTGSIAAFSGSSISQQICQMFDVRTVKVGDLAFVNGNGLGLFLPPVQGVLCLGFK